MLWSLTKIILFIGVIIGVTIGAGYLSETGGGVQISVGATEYTLAPLQAVIAGIILIVLVWLGLKVLNLLVALFKFLNGDETAISRYFDRNREKRGYEALADGLMALASGEGNVAMAKAAKAEKYLARPELTNLVAAQAADMSGNRKKSTEIYKRLLQDDRTRFVGIRGIMKQSLDDGDLKTAMKLAERAFALKPKHEETGDILLRLQADHQDWTGARSTLNEKVRQGSIPRDLHRRRDSVLALSQAREHFNDGDSAAARLSAIEANKLSPSLVPAAVMAAQSYITEDKPKLASKVLKKAWDAQPHPDLAAAFASIQPDETPQERIKRFKLLTKIQPENPETKMLLAELHIAAEDYAEARAALGTLPSDDPAARVLAIMAAIERGEGSEDSVVRGWLTKALTASRGPQWVCENCQSIHGAWGPVCSNCSGFDTFSWTTPPQVEVAMPASTEMLPLIVGEKDTDGSDLEIEPEDPAIEAPKEP